MKKSKEEAVKLYKQARFLESEHSDNYTDSGKERKQRVIEMLTTAQNICPHENYIRRSDLDADGVETWECQDCFNLNYINIRK